VLVHARIVRPPSYGAELVAVATETVEAMPGVVKVVRDGNFLAVIAEKEFQAIEAMRALTAAAQWREIASLPEAESLPDFLTQLPAQDITVLDEGNLAAATAKTASATYTRPYQAHAAIGPSCAVALFENDALTIWSYTQGVYSYGELIGGKTFSLTLDHQKPPATKDAKAHKIVGTSVPRVDIPDKVTGKFTYMHDFRVPGMLHARVVRPPAIGAKLEAVDDASVGSIAGVVKVVREGSFPTAEHHRRFHRPILASLGQGRASAAATAQAPLRRK
jgi:CO/xanthine dehydrogenase Mo-binding subunit